MFCAAAQTCATTACRTTAPPPRLCPRWTGADWELIEDHRECRAEVFFADLTQTATNYWLPGDTHTDLPRQMRTVGPLPEQALTSAPLPTEAELREDAFRIATAEAETILTARARQQAVQTETFNAEEFSVFARAGLFAAWTPGTGSVLCMRRLCTKPCRP